MKKRWILAGLVAAAVFAAAGIGVALGTHAQAAGETSTKAPSKGNSDSAMGGAVRSISRADVINMMKQRPNGDERAAAAARAKALRGGKPIRANTVYTPNATPDYFGTIPNYANSPLPVKGKKGKVTGGIRKFVDTLPGLGAANKNDLGQYIPVAVPDTSAYPGSDYYEIAVVQYTQKMHRTLPATKLRGYVQLETSTVKGDHYALTYPDGSPIKDSQGNQIYSVTKPQYMGPTIVSERNRPVRFKVVNLLPIGVAGDLFLPVDTTLMGAGTGPNGGTEQYTQNRSVIHLHGGATPWISDGTPHQWITPAGETTTYKGRQYAERAGHARSGPRSRHALLHQPAERPTDVLPRPRLRHHPAQRLRR